MFERKGMNLQWFAEEPAADSPAEPQEPQEQPKPAPQPEQKPKPEPKPAAEPQHREEEDPSQELETLRRENARLKAEAARAALRDTAAGLLAECKLEASPEVLDLVTGEDEEQTKARVAHLNQYVKAQIQAAEKTRATGRTPRSYGGGENSPKTAFQQKLDKYKPKKG